MHNKQDSAAFLLLVAVVVEALAALDAQLARGDLLLNDAHRLEERLVLRWQTRDEKELRSVLTLKLDLPSQQDGLLKPKGFRHAAKPHGGGWHVCGSPLPLANQMGEAKQRLCTGYSTFPLAFPLSLLTG